REAAPDPDPEPDPVGAAGGVDGPGGYDGPVWAGYDGPGLVGPQGRTDEAGDDARPAAGDMGGGSWGNEPRETWEPAAGNAVFGGYQQDPPPAGPVRGGGSGYRPGRAG